MKTPVVYHVAPNKSLDRWKIFRAGKKPKMKGLTKEDALEAAYRLAKKKAGATTVLVHKTRYIIERQLQFSLARCN